MPEEQATQEVSLNCSGCGKPLKKLKRYYRNGKYYCGKKCFKNKSKSAQEK